MRHENFDGGTERKCVPFCDVNLQHIIKKLKQFPCQFVPNFVSYVFAKYYLNWFTVGKVITETKKVKFFMRHSVDRVTTTSLLSIIC